MSDIEWIEVENEDWQWEAELPGASAMISHGDEGYQAHIITDGGSESESEFLLTFDEAEDWITEITRGWQEGERQLEEMMRDWRVGGFL